MRNKRIFSIQGHDKNNSGDYASNPFNYFEVPFEVERINLKEFFSMPLKELDIFKNETLIFGGGGMLIFGKWLTYLAKIKGKGKYITWGIGHNRHHQSQIEHYPRYLETFDLNGIRDYCTKYRWVPCASCMSPLFEQPDTPQYDIVVYEHKDFPLNLSQFPRLDNAGKSFEEKVEFLATGATIITNSYHGAYWGMLMGRKVLVLEPFSSKFMGLHPDITLAERNEWPQALQQLKTFPDYLAYCREANRNFHRLVVEILTQETAYNRIKPYQPTWQKQARLHAYRMRRKIVKRFESGRRL